MADGFFSRWSRRKEAVREGRPLQEEPVQVPAPVAPAAAAAAPQAAEAAPQALAPEPPPTMDDVQALTPKDDFTRFVAPEVPPDVKNAALRKLFTDPLFNAMDGLDVYIDDYGKPDPIPPAMLKKLAASRFLKLFEDEEKKEQEKQGREVEHDPTGESVAQSGTGAPAVPPPEDHAHADLRLQQDHAPGPRGPGQGDR
ncbi:MAG TPA: DUF3306 domain-containing protein [Ramlibacter sp.]|nr:DUF3306 domain-containing protein [Ramlibacter sp.]